MPGRKAVGLSFQVQKYTVFRGKCFSGNFQLGRLAEFRLLSFKRNSGNKITKSGNWNFEFLA